MRRANVFYKNIPAGILIEDEEGYHFSYSEDYIRASGDPVSRTLPLSEEEYTSPLLFPFFDGLIPEGWLLDIAQKNWKLNPRDRMGLLLKTCYDCIGAVSIIPIENPEGHE